MHIECWMSEATETHLEYVIHIVLQWQQLLHELGSLLGYSCIACLVAYEHNN